MQTSPPDKLALQEPAKPTITPCSGGPEWRWSEENRKEWREIFGGDEYLEFYRFWSGPNARSNFRNEFPYQLSLGAGPPLSLQGKPILITDAYDNMLRRLSHLREEDRRGGRIKGAVITGQSGIGKTIFQKYMLAQLISTQEVVLLCDSNRILLFFCNKLYHRLTISGFDFLPIPPPGRKHPIWALVDQGRPKEPPITESTDIWPVQTSSLNPIQWANWAKHNKAAMLGMPLWNMEELKIGLPLQSEYDTFRTRLQNRIFPSTTPDPSTIPNPVQDKQIAATVEAVRMDMVRLAEWAAAADRDKGIEPMKVDGEARPPPALGTMDLVFLLLLRNATEEFGLTPRDVYDGIFNILEVKERHATKLNALTYDKLMTLPAKFTAEYLLDDFSHHVVAVNPVKFIPRRDRWTMDFKSARIVKEVARLMVSVEHRHLRDTYHLLHNTSASSGMAGAIFEGIAHRVLCGNAAPQPTPMKSDNGTPPIFSTPHVAQASAVVSGVNTLMFSTLPPYERTKARIIIDLLRDLRGVTSDSSRYYIPASATNPLFDSFTVTLNPSNYSAVVSVFHIATSLEHGGSSDGYPLIRKIIAHARGLLNCPTGQQADISVEYILVCPEDGSRHQWTMPVGWDDCNSINNQIGNGFCIRIPSYYLTVGY